MIARVTFEGIVKDGKKKSILTDSVDIHVPPGAIKQAKEIFLSWVAKSYGIRGRSHVFHPLFGNGDIKITNVKEIVSNEKISL